MGVSRSGGSSRIEVVNMERFFHFFFHLFFYQVSTIYMLLNIYTSTNVYPFTSISISISKSPTTRRALLSLNSTLNPSSPASFK